MTNGRRRGGLSTSRSFSTGQLLGTHRRFYQLQSICQSIVVLPQMRRSAAPSRDGRTANLQKRLRLMWRPVWSYYTIS
ncbi:hypothetical protein DPMN_110081 [Dreissena polymorpha]|uniref:Uncharacterized protein n=1 Tax=Dreissena polymorpha TaxID=45954 RepID=A0A9D4KBH7_DREPO|nr:hypothetical protein DPMN_110081 [Dreissena polymorpha]